MQSPANSRFAQYFKAVALATALIAALITVLTAVPATAAQSEPEFTAAATAVNGYAIAAYEDEAYPDWCDEESVDYDPDAECEEPADPPEEDPDQQEDQPGDQDGAPTPEPPDIEEPPPGPPFPEELPSFWPPTPNGQLARIGPDGRRAVAPRRAPRLVKRLIRAANRITRMPYKWGGGHARLRDSGYDCSGSVSYVLREAGLVRGSMVSGGFKRWGRKGAGRWVNVYANNGHVFLVIAGLRFDTSGAGEHGPRWRAEPRGVRGFKLRHPAGY